ncbi:MAG: hypothetical protein ACJ75H_08680 [Thermoanaerobaculia bacterium]
MEIRDLDRIRFVTRHYNDLQGLRSWVPLGLVLLGLASPPLLRAVLILGALLLWLGATRYYKETFGAVLPPPMDPVAETYPVSVFTPAGPAPRLQIVRPVTPLARHFFVIATLALVLFSYFQALPTNFVVQGDASLGQHPRILTAAAPFYGPPWIEPYPNGGLMRPPSMLRAVVSQTMYLVFGCFFLSLWIWRERRPSQSASLAFAGGLLGLCALGTSLGYVSRPDGEIPAILDRFLPALVYPGVALLVCGSLMVLTGLLDHGQLDRALGRPAPEEASI